MHVSLQGWGLYAEFLGEEMDAYTWPNSKSPISTRDPNSLVQKPRFPFVSFKWGQNFVIPRICSVVLPNSEYLSLFQIRTVYVRDISSGSFGY